MQFAIMCPSTSWQGQLWVHYSLDTRRSLHHRAGGYEVFRLFIRHSWQHQRELFRPPRPTRSLRRSQSQIHQRRREPQRLLSLPRLRCGHQLLPNVINPSGVGTCPFGGKATALPGLKCAPLAGNSRSRKDATPTVPGDISWATVAMCRRCTHRLRPPATRTPPLNPHKHRLQRQAEQSRAHSVSLLHPPGAFNLGPFSRVHPEEHLRRTSHHTTW